MSVIGSNVLAGASGSAVAGYEIARSLRFNDADTSFLGLTPSSASSGNTKLTYSVWVKGANAADKTPILSASSAGGSESIEHRNDGTLVVFFDEYVDGAYTTSAVFRDPSAWYHYVFSIDTTLATAADRVKIYVNGVQVSTTASPALTQNFSFTGFNQQSKVQYIGRTANTSGGQHHYADAMYADIHMIDGQALDPTDFAEYDENNSWQPKEYEGTFGTNGYHLDFSDSTSTTTVAEDSSGNNNDFSASNLSVENPIALPGVAFDGTGDYLSLADSADWELGNTFTIEAYIYVSTDDTYNTIVAQASSGNNYYLSYAGTNNNLEWFNYNGSVQLNSATNSISLNKWHHIALVNNSGTGQFYVDGVASGSSGSAGTVSDSSDDFRIGAQGTSHPFNGFISNLRVVKGTAVYTSAFTRPDAPLSNITNTKLLCCQSNSSATAATVAPGTITANGDASATEVTDSTSANDSLIDTPTNNTASSGNNGGNYCTWNPVYPTFATTSFSNGNLDSSIRFTNSTAVPYAVGTIAVSSGKWYWEITLTQESSDTEYIGVIDGSKSSGAWVFADIGAYLSDARKTVGTTPSNYGATYTTGDVLGIALDADNGSLTFYKNGTSQGVAVTGMTLASYKPFTSANGTSTAQLVSANFGQRPFKYTNAGTNRPAATYLSLCSTNLPDPTIADGSDYFDIQLWTGNATDNRDITGYGFSPDLVWIKERGSTGDNHLFDIVRGATKALRSNVTDAEVTDANELKAFNTDGFRLGTGGDVNASGTTTCGWAWDAGSSTASNTDGSITSSVRANQTAGFSIVSYTGNGHGQAVGSSTATVGHGLNAKPEFIIVKNREDSQDWSVYHVGTDATAPENYYLSLNKTDSRGANSSSDKWSNIAPTSSVFTLGSSASVNRGNNDHIAYCFAPVDQFSAFGVYTSNNLADGPFVSLSFRPRWIMFKNIDSTWGWYIHDTERSPDNSATEHLIANASNAEATFAIVDILSNGFKLTAVSEQWNKNTDKIIYVAFAENPFSSNGGLAR